MSIKTVMKDQLLKDIFQMCPNPSSVVIVDYIVEKLEAQLLTEDIDIEPICEKVHQAYCQYQLDHGKKEYWTKGDYSKLDDSTKEIDRYTVRAVIKAIISKQEDKG